ETASFASRILPSRSQTKTGSGAFAMMMSAASVGLAARSTTGDRVSDMALPSGRPIGSFARPGLLGSLQIVQNGVAVVDPVVTYRLRWVFAGCAVSARASALPEAIAMADAYAQAGGGSRRSVWGISVRLVGARRSIESGRYRMNICRAERNTRT